MTFRRFAPVALFCALFLTLASDHARATVVQVDGTIVPAGNNLQAALNAYEGVAPPAATAIDAVLDAAELPEIFLPSTTSVVTFTDIAEGAGFENSFGYYNVGDDPTVGANLRPIMGCGVTAATHANEVPNYNANAEPATSVTVNFATELSSGRYRGGFIAFYLITPEGNPSANNCGDFVNGSDGLSLFGRAYFTERDLNNDGDFVHHLVYQSRITANRFYFGYEDLFRGGDNDYEDMAMQVTGLVPPCIPTAEVCDGRDNNCNGSIDEGTGGAACSCDGSGGLTCEGGNRQGLCRTGATACVAGALLCRSSVTPTAETCDGEDDNCDGTVDNSPSGVGVACDGTDVDTCNEGVTACTAGALTCTDPNGANPESCNGLDEDCDTRIDETVAGLGVACDGSDGDACAEGVTTCTGGALACSDATGNNVELCNGVDDDCDTAVDDAPTDVGVACSVGIGSCLRNGATVCTAGAPRCNVVAGTGSAERCNALDDDCDGNTDETFMLGTACTAPGECGGGVLECAGPTGTRCSSGPGGSMSMAGIETCNGLDDDCDTRTDEGLTDLGACGASTGECSPGRLQCIGALATCVGGVGPTPETCNTRDDDCDGSSDERGATGLTDEGASCGDDTGECTAGTEVCTLGALVCTGAVGPTPETCNALDDDCNAIVDDSPTGVGGTCGTTSVGECDLGGLICIAGGLVCSGATEPQSEVCNGLDDDCDGMTDDDPIDVGRTCGSAMGTCTPGTTVCRAGMVECDGATPGVPEICNGIDDDCNTVIDDFTTDEGGVCGSGTGACEEGALRCIAGALQCVGGVLPSTETCNGLDDDCNDLIDDGDLCEGGVCRDGMCSLPCEAGEFPCAPGFECVEGFCLVDPCYGVICEAGADGTRNVCSDGDCVPICDTRPCDAPNACRRTDGACVENTCIFIPYLCSDTERCEGGTCVSDPCEGVSCGAAEFCRDGDCIGSCGGVECEATEVCRGGTCESTGCSEACATGEVCRAGSCVADTCRTTTCEVGQVCNPESGTCIDDPCRNITCPEGERCSLGECFDPPSTPDAGMPTMDAGGRVDVLATGSPLCSVRPGLSGRGGAGWMFLLALGLILGARRRIRALSAAAILVGLFGGILSGCAVEPYCVRNCGEDQLDGAIDGALDGDAGRDANTLRPEACVPGAPEICNLFDDDCDTNVDEDFDLETNEQNCGECGNDCALTGARVECVASACQFNGCFDGFFDIDTDPTNGCEYRCFRSNGGVEACDGLDNDCNGEIDETFDFPTDELNCGRCGQECRFFRVASATCEAGTCRFDPLTDCEPGYIDRDGLPGSGCEFECTPTGAETCNGLDDDCDGRADEDFNLDTSITDCGRCGRTCTFPNATPSCAAGTCGFDPMTDCNPGFSDHNGVQLDGCEYPCVPTADPTEICDGVDNDCDGRVDGPTTDAGGACNNAPSGTATGACTNTGTVTCIGGTLDCIGAPSPRGETCNGIDDDCDGTRDDAPTDVGRVCATAVGVCSAGFSVCTAGTLGCVRSVMPSAELCNGLDDDCNGSIDDAPTDASLGTACGTDVGACMRGTRTCVGGAILCTGGIDATLETCNGIDDDCDTMVDDDPVDEGGSCGTDTGACVPGSLVCTSGSLVCTGGVMMTTETCNNQDDNCNGTTDEGISMTCYTGLPGTRSVGRCRDGTSICSAGTMSACAGQVLPTGETCNNIDDNCSGAIDEGVTTSCYGGPGGTAGVGLCRTGLQSCTAGMFTGACVGEVRPATETCNNQDDNCNGAVDEAVTRACYTGTSGTAGVGTCRSGTETCTVGAFGTCVGEIVPAREWCGDSLNTDCDANTTDLLEGCLSAGTELRLDEGALGGNHSFDVEIASAGSPAGRAVYAVWADNTNGNTDIFFTRSTDGGATFGAVTNLTAGIAERCVEPVIVAARDTALGSDRVYVAYQRVAGGIRHLRVARSSDAGASFTTSADLDTTGTTDNFKHQLAISADGTRVALVWEQLRTDDLTRRVLSRASTDSGATFAGERLVSVNVAATANAGKPRVFVTSSGRFVFAWRERRAPRTTFDVFATYSDDTSTAIPLAREVRIDDDAADNRDSDDLRLASDGNRVFLVYNDLSTITTGDSDVVLARSINDGAAWPAANLRTIDDPTLEVSQSETPQLVIDPGVVGTGGDERVYVAWRDTREGTQIYLSRSDDAGVTFLAPVRASHGLGLPVSGIVSSPRMAFIGADTLVIVYTNGAAGRTSIRASVSPDRGVSWNLTDPTLNTVSTNSDAPALTPFTAGAAPTLGAVVTFIDYRGAAVVSGAPVVNGDVRRVRVGR